jgi:uncharacterized protein (UPF0210 family)
MINLIPNKDKKHMRQDFYFRLTTIVFMALALSMVVACIALFPAYLLSSVKKDLASTQALDKKNEAMPRVDEDTNLAINDLNKKIALVERAEKNKFSVSSVIVDQILNSITEDIKITSIAYDESPDKALSVRGQAANREKLLVFRKALESNPFFQKVDLPISNFVKDSDIKFYLNITIATP